MPTFENLTPQKQFADPFMAPALQNAMRFSRTFSAMSPGGSYGSTATKGEAKPNDQKGGASIQDMYPGGGGEAPEMKEQTPYNNDAYAGALGNSAQVAPPLGAPPQADDWGGSGIPSTSGEATGVTARPFSRKRRSSNV